MRALYLWGALLVVAAVVVVTGLQVQSRPPPPRAQDQTTAVDAGWYARLPADADAATEAYVARIPATMRATGEHYSDTRLVAFTLRVANLLLATALLCALRFGPRLRGALGRFTSRALVADSLFVLLYLGAIFVLTLPGELYGDYVRPHQSGFTEQLFGQWLSDAAISYAVLAVFYVIGILAIYRLMRRSASRWVYWSVGVYLILRATYTLLSPGFIEPLTNSFTQLPEGPQKQEILALATAAGVRNAEIVTGNASRQTRVPNAHVSGLGGSARISVDDNTLSSSSDAMLRAVVGHELGHYALHHEEILVLADTAVMFVGFLFVAGLNSALVRRWGSRLAVGSVGDMAGLPLFWGAFLLWGFLSQPFTNAISRVVEHQADLYSLEHAREPNGLAEFMIHDADNARLSPKPLEYALFYTHPGDVARVRTAMQWRAAHPAGK